MASKKCNAVHPLNVFTIPLSGPGFQPIIRKQPSKTKFWDENNQQQQHLIQNQEEEDDEDTDRDALFEHRFHRPPAVSTKAGELFFELGETPKGLESLQNLEHLFIKQSQLITDFFLNVENKYEVLNSSGEFVYLAAETTPPLTRIFCFGGPPFEIAINTLPGRGAYSWNAKGTEVLKLKGTPGSCGCGSEVSVSHARKVLGSIEQEGDCLAPLYIIKDDSDKEILQIQGPSKPHCFSCTFSKPETSRGNLKFDILSADGKTLLGRIAKQWADPIQMTSQINGGVSMPPDEEPRRRREPATSNSPVKQKDCEMWGIKFPAVADKETKGLLLSTLFLLEYQYYTGES